MSRIESDSSLRVYLREISKTDLLTPQEEVQLAARIKKGDMIGDNATTSLLGHRLETNKRSKMHNSRIGLLIKTA